MRISKCVCVWAGGCESKAEGYINLNDMGAVYCGMNFEEDLGNLYGQLNLMYFFSWHRIEKEGSA